VLVQEWEISRVLPLLQDIFNAYMYLAERGRIRGLEPQILHVKLHCGIVSMRSSRVEVNRREVQATGGTDHVPSIKYMNEEKCAQTTPAISTESFILISNYLIPQ
jgi:hypothetical protein